MTSSTGPLLLLWAHYWGAHYWGPTTLGPTTWGAHYISGWPRAHQEVNPALGRDPRSLHSLHNNNKTIVRLVYVNLFRMLW